MPQMRTYRGHFLLVVLAITDASDKDLQRLLTFGGLDVADASNEDLQGLFPIWRICCSHSLKRGRALDNVMICMCTWTNYSIKIVLSLIYQCKNRKTQNISQVVLLPICGEFPASYNCIHLWMISPQWKINNTRNVCYQISLRCTHLCPKNL